MNSEDRYQTILDKTAGRTIPFKILWELTYQCNLRCKHCYVCPEPQREELSTDEITSLIDHLYDLGGLFITFTGGEVLSRGDFFDIASHARKKGFAIRIFTNGTLITQEVAEKIKGLSPLSVEISLYASNPSIHDGITKTVGSFHKTVDALRMLTSKGVPVKMKSPLMKDNVGEYEHLKCFAHELHLRFSFDINLIPKNDGNKRPLNYRLSESNLKSLFFARDSSIPWKEREIHVDEPVCNAGFNSVAISPYGDVFPCVGLKMKMGNVKEKRFETIWNSRKFKVFRSLNRFSHLKECFECNDLPYCRRCPGVALAEDGNLLGPSTAACKVMRVKKLTEEKVNANK